AFRGELVERRARTVERGRTEMTANDQRTAGRRRPARREDGQRGREHHEDEADGKEMNRSLSQDSALLSTNHTKPNRFGAPTAQPEDAVGEGSGAWSESRKSGSGHAHLPLAHDERRLRRGAQCRRAASSKPLTESR